MKINLIITFGLVGHAAAVVSGTSDECTEIVSFEDFENNDASAWQNGVISTWGDDIDMGKFLGRYGRGGVGRPSRMFTLPWDVGSYQIDFDFYETDKWEKENAISIYVCDQMVTMGQFNEANEDQNDAFTNEATGVHLERYVVTDGFNMGFGEYDDQIHHVTVTVDSQCYQGSGELYVEFFFAFDEPIEDESYGIDNFQLSAPGYCDSETSSVIPTESAMPSATPSATPTDSAEPSSNPSTVPTESAHPSATPSSAPTESAQPTTEHGPVCTGPTGRGSGDPHMTTFDNVKYDCQGEGEFVLVQNEEFNAQARFVTGFTDRPVTVTKAIVFKIDDAPKIQVSVPEGNAETCDYEFLVDDELQKKEDLGISPNITVMYIGKSVLFHHPDTGARVEVSVQRSEANGCVMAYQFCLPNGTSKRVDGLLGTPNGDKSDEWTKRDGTEVQVPNSSRKRRYAPAYEYCIDWCVLDQEESMFSYEEGSNFSHYNSNCKKPYDDSLERAMENIPLSIKEICGDNDACLIDGVQGGEEDAISLVAVEAELDKLKEEPPANPIETPSSSAYPSFTPTVLPTDSAYPSSTPTVLPTESAHPSSAPTVLATDSDHSTPTAWPTLRPLTSLRPTASWWSSWSPIPTTNGSWWLDSWEFTRFVGDPHLTTFDNVGYDCQGHGEFVLVQNEKYNVQARFVAGLTDIPVTVTKAIVFKLDDAPKIQVNIPEEHVETCDYNFIVDDIPSTKEDLDGHSPKMAVSYIGKSIVFHHPDTAATVEVSVERSSTMGCMMAFQLSLPHDESTVMGLLGTPNGDDTDDWIKRDGTQVSIPTSGRERRFAPAYEFCIDWCVRDEQESMFAYTEFQSYSDYNTNCKQPYDDSLERAMENVPQTIIDICGDNDACIIDGILGGEEDARNLLEIEEELDEFKEEIMTTTALGGMDIYDIVASMTDASTTNPPTSDGGASGDPHFKTWAGEHYDYHGICDLVLLENHSFQDDQGMDIHIRTKKIKQWSYISNAVLRIGDDTLEVMGSKKEGSRYWVNGFEGGEITASNSILASTLSGYPITFERINKKQQEFIVHLGDEETIVLKTWNDMVRVDILGATAENFGRSKGLMGKFNTGEHMARDNVTELKDLNAFGQEWQVQRTEGKLFRMLEGPQAPRQCETPSSVEVRRRLGESLITQDQAERACSHVSSIDDRELCIFDVMATNDIDLAGAY